SAGPLSTTEQSNRRVWCPNLCCAFKREHGYGSVFHPHRSESWPKRTIVWSIQLRQSDGTDNKSRSDAARFELWRAVRGSAAERGHHLHAHRVSALSLVDVGEFHANDAFVCDAEPHRSGFEVQRWPVRGVQWSGELGDVGVRKFVPGTIEFCVDEPAARGEVGCGSTP